ncbi:CoA transferase (plasmid) [Arthrobacter sp. Z1-9]
MLLSDLGASVTRVERVTNVDVRDINVEAHAVLTRGRRSVALDLTTSSGAAAAQRLIDRADVLLEGFRPGVLERLGFAPEALSARNPRLVIGRVTGWGQDGPRAATAGHDINYLAVSGMLAATVASDGTPVAPLNVLGDFGAGGLLLAFGVLAAVYEAQRTGQGQVVDTAIVDGTALFTGMLHAMRHHGMWDDDSAGGNIFDGGAPFYGVYRTRDNEWIAVGAIEPKFYNRLIETLGLGDALHGLSQHDRSHWPQTRDLIAQAFAGAPLASWMEAFTGVDACVTPVIRSADVHSEPHLASRAVYSQVHGMTHPAPAPRFSRHADLAAPTCVAPGRHTRATLQNLDFDEAEIEEMMAQRAARQAGVTLRG